MARDKNPYDDDYDGRPGGRGLSTEFAKRYDPQLEQEYTNLPFNREQIAGAHFEQDLEQTLESAQDMRAAARGRVQFFHGFGRIVLPREPTFAALLPLAQDYSKQGVCFDPEQYEFFDRVVLREAKGRDDIFLPEHPDFPKYEGLRTNIAVMRNYIAALIKFGGDGTFDAGDEKDIPTFVAIARELGKGLANEKKPLTRLFSPHLNSRIMNIEGEGAAYAYDFLLKRQQKPGLLSGFSSFFDALLHRPSRSWGLPPLEDTPFSKRGLHAPPPRDKLCLSEEELAALGVARGDNVPSRLDGKTWREKLDAERLLAKEPQHVLGA